MKAGQSLLVRVQDSGGTGRPARAVLLVIALFWRGRKRYQFLLPPSDARGEVQISYAEIESMRRAEAAVYLMDYNTPLESCDDRFSLTMPSGSQLQQMQAVLKQQDRAEAHALVRQMTASSNHQYTASEMNFLFHDQRTSVVFPVRSALL